jgi:arginase
MQEYPDVRIILVPYDSGHPRLRMGAGPEHLLDNGIGEALRSRERGLSFTTVHPKSDPPVEVATALELDGLVSGQVRGALAEGEFPLVLSGNCNISVGTLAGAGPERLGIVWFDAHADFNTPETTTTGFSDGMGLAIAVGHCWEKMAEDVPGFYAVAEEDVVLVGVREVDPAEEERLAASDVAVVSAELMEHGGLRVLAKALDTLRTRVGRVYVHLDLDVLDAGKVGRANSFAPDGGLSAEELEMALGEVRRKRFAVAAAGIASYDPAFDADGRVLRAAVACVRVLTSPAGPAV